MVILLAFEPFARLNLASMYSRANIQVYVFVPRLRVHYPTAEPCSPCLQVTDARAALAVYHMYQASWEFDLRKARPSR